MDIRKRGAAYGRQSHGKETSVEDQIRVGEAWLEQNGCDVHRRYQDKVSASRHSTKEREDWPKLVVDVTAGELDILWLWDSSRGDRKAAEWLEVLEQCRNQGVLIHVHRDRHTYDLSIPRDWKSLADSGIDAQYDSDIKSVDVRRGTEGAALAGKPHGRPAYGFTRQYDPNDRRIFTEVPNEKLPVAIEIVERVASNDPIVHIERDLNGTCTNTTCERQVVVPIPEPVSPQTLATVVSAALAEHVAARKVSVSDYGGLRLVRAVVDGVVLPWRDVDLSKLDGDERDEAYKLALSRDRAAKVDRHAPAMQRLTLVTLGAGRAELVVTIHGPCPSLRPGGIPGPKGGRWYRATIKLIATNPAYIGLRRHKGTTHPGNWDGVINESTFHDATAVLRNPSRKKTKPGRHKYLSSYIVTAPCGAGLHAMGDSRGARRRPTYHCVGNGCVGIGIWELDEHLTRAVLARLCEPDARALFERSDEEAESARVGLAKLTAELEEWRESADQPDGISAIALARKERALGPLIEDAKRRIAETTVPVAVHALLSDGQFTEETARPRWDSLSVAAQRTVITALVERITVIPAEERLSRWSTDEDRLRTAGKRARITFRKPEPREPEPQEAEPPEFEGQAA